MRFIFSTFLLDTGGPGARLLSDESDQTVGQRAAPAYAVVAADELLIVNFVTLRQKNVPQMPSLRQNTESSAQVQLEVASVQVKLQGELRTRDIQPGHLVQLRHRVGVAVDSILRTPPDRTGLAQNISEHARMPQA